MKNISEFNLRNIDTSDKDIILYWRNSEHVRKNMYTDHIISIGEHDQWFDKALVDENSRYLIFEYNKRPVGFVAFTCISMKHQRCTWAFYLGETDVPKGTGAMMEFFALSYAFEVLGIRKLCCEVFLFNTNVIKLHEKFGFKKEGHFTKHYSKNDIYEDIVCLAKFKDNWSDEKELFKLRYFGKNA